MRYKKARYLIERRNADINARDRVGWTSLHCAANRSQVEVFEYLLDKGASLNTLTEDESTVLHYFARFETLHKLPWAFDVENEDLNSERVYERLGDLLRRVITLGVDINAKNKTGDTPLHIAAYVLHLKLTSIHIQSHDALFTLLSMYYDSSVPGADSVS